MYYLYEKTHNVTGLKYLGYTQRDDYDSYQGSGTYWNLHIKKHGYDVTTELIRACKTKQELEAFGLFCSKVLNVVQSEEWANLKEECGAGGPYCKPKKLETVKRMKEYHNRPEIKAAFTQRVAGINNPMYGKSATKGKKWYYDPITKKSNRYFENAQPDNYIAGRT